MCPSPGIILNNTAIASLAFPSAVSVAPRVQSHRSQLVASFGNKCPQYGHGILSALTSCRWVGASVYSKLPPNDQGNLTRRIEFVKQTYEGRDSNQRCKFLKGGSNYR